MGRLTLIHKTSRTNNTYHRQLERFNLKSLKQRPFCRPFRSPSIAWRGKDIGLQSWGQLIGTEASHKFGSAKGNRISQMMQNVFFLAFQVNFYIIKSLSKHLLRKVFLGDFWQLTPSQEVLGPLGYTGIRPSVCHPCNICHRHG